MIEIESFVSNWCIRETPLSSLITLERSLPFTRKVTFVIIQIDQQLMQCSNGVLMDFAGSHNNQALGVSSYHICYPKDIYLVTSGLPYSLHQSHNEGCSISIADAEEIPHLCPKPPISIIPYPCLMCAHVSLLIFFMYCYFHSFLENVKYICILCRFLTLRQGSKMKSVQVEG